MGPVDERQRTTPVAEVDALGIRVAIHAGSAYPAAVVAEVADAWRDCRTARIAPVLRRRTELPATDHLDAARLLSDLSTRVTLEALSALRGTRLLLHAAGVAAPDGRVLALVGPSGRGKTTAVRHLGGHFGYVSDESVAVDPDLSVSPYRKPLSLIVEGRPFKQQVAPSGLGLLPLPDTDLTLAGITLLERTPHTDEPVVLPLDLIDAISEMTPQISYLAELPSPLQFIARIVDRIGSVTRVVYADATDLPQLVASMFTAPTPAAQTWTVAPPGVRTGPWRCTEVDDAILVDGRACILREGIVSVLDRRGCLAWTMCLRGATTEQITAAAVAAFGEPGHDSAPLLIERTLQDLRTHGLITGA
ncbi:hypothetical protein [Microbacterium sp.]|jgi:hypothetical protein|uniref:hypothetical protein n=1 Tax=Microbacterium sp. TaxID=51671 RepID=UPI0037CBB3F3